MEHRVSTLSEFTDTINEIKKDKKEIWFRGHADANFKMEPASHRLKRNIRPTTEKTRDFKLTQGDVIMPNEWTIREEFKSLYEESHSNTITDFECLYLMQHYGVYTRLLDFSTDPKIALYFALSQRPIRIPPVSRQEEIQLSDYDLSSFDAAVYCVDPEVINFELHGKDKIVEVNESWMPFLDKMYPPLAINTSFDDKRIKAQCGVFILFGALTKPLEDIFFKQSHIHKIIIPNKYISTIYAELRANGLRHFNIYPDFKGKVMDLNEDMINNLNRSYNALTDGATETLLGG